MVDKMKHELRLIEQAAEIKKMKESNAMMYRLLDLMDKRVDLLQYGFNTISEIIKKDY